MQEFESPIIIDAEKCVACGLCAKDCPLGVIVVDKEAGSAAPHPKRAERCFACGHCMAVCPTGAIRLSRFGGREAIPVRSELAVTLDQVEQFMRSRRSVRAFKAQALERAVLERLMGVTAYAPSGHNERKVEWAVVATPEAVQTVSRMVADWMQLKVDEKHPLVQSLHLRGVVRACRAGADLICRNAPALALAHAPREGATPAEDAVIAASHVELAAHAAGLGACWAGYVTHAVNGHQPLAEYLGIPEGHVVYATLMLGHPAVRYAAIPPREMGGVNWVE
ncbi:nitroreductase/NAD-dependent dihydropyrimidine dehydrogenase PreA subunit [Desulfobaculum xiamenense]|uniref:Nitroreductase/NAD-dependent dihydropyrimidine dehydrogenase PreA subunit n=1 Tax=Desulfobaculum xiamenense TaxID=995050 RepID=A0A846QSC0_9BACT|nr:nitroreductase family protein [Desulfobaculum xiamenense]NJB68335.1 nitroreductase/NAD-dependent dihydropyrimidine dehydrogenase PreA subunit [Desulfobaculum xiamenense]